MVSRTASQAGVSQGALDLLCASDVIDLHVDSYIWTRVFGYDLTARHNGGVSGGRLFNQFDLPRARQAGFTGAMWSITTYPWRSARGRARALSQNVLKLSAALEASGQVRVVRSYSDYLAARQVGLHAALLTVQGGNAFDADEDVLPSQRITAITLLHMTDSAVGSTSSPLRLRRDRGLGPRGAALIARANAARTFVDLAHISPRGFWQAVQQHDKTQPLIVTHTGVSAVHASWRNLDDAQIKQVVDTGGVIGVIFHGLYLSGHLLGGPLSAVVRHIAHVIAVAGEDAVALGSDWDGFIVPPAGLRSCADLPRLVQALLDHGIAERAVHKLLGQNFLKSFQRLRP